MLLCSVPSCPRRVSARGLCAGHYYRDRHGLPMDPPLRPRAVGIPRTADGLCGHPPCDRPYKACGLCARHEAILRKYGLTPARFEALGDACRACGGVDDLCVDHDHSCCPGKTSCGKCVRGLLCAPCNKSLGLLGDDPGRIRALATYLEQHASQS